MKRKMLAARLDLADKISDIASRKGTLFDYVNEILEQSIRAEKLGLSPKEILDDMWMIKTVKDSGFTLIPKKIIYEMIEEGFISDKKKLNNLWYETGEWYGKYYENLERFSISVKKYFWEISEFSFSFQQDILNLTCLSSKFSKSYSEFFGKFLEGAFNALGYDLIKSDISKGIINISFFKSKGE